MGANNGVTITRAPARAGLRQILDGISLRLESGQSLAVSGPSGAGKTTLLHLLAGVLQPSQGKVLIADEPTSELDAENRTHILRLLKAEVARRKIVVVASDDADVVAACDSELALRGGRARESAHETFSTH